MANTPGLCHCLSTYSIKIRKIYWGWSEQHKIQVEIINSLKLGLKTNKIATYYLITIQPRFSLLLWWNAGYFVNQIDKFVIKFEFLEKVNTYILEDTLGFISLD